MNDPMRIAMDMTFPNRNAAGSSMYAVELLRELQRREDVAVHEVAANAGGLPGTMSWLAGGARAAVAATDLVHCPAFVAPWGMHKPFVLTVHDTSIFDFPEDHAFEWRAYIRTFLGRRARAASRVITGTEHSRREIIQDLGVPAERIAVTPYGVAARFNRVTPHPAQAAGGGLDAPRLLFPGAPSRRKNLELVLAGMAEAPAGSVFRRAYLAISGADRDDFPTYRDRVKALGLEARVRWQGKVPPEEMPGLMEASDAIVYPSLQEGFGFPALEAMSLGTPVIASNTSCLPEVLGDGALLVDPTDVKGFIAAAEAVLTRPELRQELIAKGRARASHFTWERCADLTIAVYREALLTRL
ncbi:MAG TPA: glycosyltransferase family 1 protein [Candidatus Dormibacteraeota bacterium]|nr:glycosyltransferase family 1 protein [Candidatus Dormibacteraeota bacterium]